jgi:sirohydrochlorin cobaltochelatase
MAGDIVKGVLQAALARGSCYIGQIAVGEAQGRFILSHRDDQERHDLDVAREAEQAFDIARFDDCGDYRPLKTAPNLRHGWRLKLSSLDDVTRALDHFYPGRLAVFAAWKKEELKTTLLRQTLNRQSGMYRVAGQISDDQLNDVVAGFCRSDGGCLRTILWRRDASGSSGSTKLPPAKFDPDCDQAQAYSQRLGVADGTATVIPLLCQEACHLLVAECRQAVKAAP